MFNYTPLYANGKEPVIEEQDVYRIEIPYVPTLQGSDIDTTQKTTLHRKLHYTEKYIDKYIERYKESDCGYYNGYSICNSHMSRMQPKV